MESITSTPKYDQYIDSGYEWIGEIPLHWDLVKLGSCLSPVSVKNCSELPLLSITREQGVIERDVDDQESNHNFIPDDLSGYKKLEKGQFGMNKMKAWQGSYGVSKFTGIVSPAYFVFDFTKAINPEFFNWAIRSKLYISFFGSASDGVRIGQWDLSKTRMKVIPFVLPSEEEQSLIANFLDKKATQINDAIAIKEQQINLLKERKQIIIQQAVTQGLDLNVPMKDSGVDWIGKIPAHWATVTVKHLADVRDGTHDTPLYVEETNKSRYLITSKDFDGKSINFSNAKSISIKDHFEISKRSKVETGDVLMSMIGGNIGKSLIVEGFSDFSIKNVALFKTNGDLTLSRFIQYYLVSGLLEKLLAIKSRGGAQPFLSLTDIRNLILFKLPADEMNKIVDYLDSETAAHEAAISIQYQQIEKLKEYKTTLINSAVTGKIKITPEMVEQ
ncbi:restriction endonuclease subunit S [Vibrio cholerae]|uniref:restriction endonuclease subunit S n=1 Tax=Vibrio cholerae TaxID=666 RepID=UPI00115B83D9|nr:restriction endonuclease subunit S [Vibrio cholerae]TQP49143.1 restriction endonuclease subunit S [Vibrio cholerae]